MSQITCRNTIKRLALSPLSLSVLPAIAGVLITARSGLAQYAACQPPRSGEYLLLVVSQTPDAQARVRSTLPTNADATLCTYFQDTVTRVGGFQSSESATSWANYFSGTVGLSAFVTRPPNGGITAQQPGGTLPEGYPTTATNASYNPQLLGSGYAVIVQYNNRPEIAAQVSQILNRQIGLASYGQRPFLLAAHTTDRRIADSVLRSLSDRGFTATMVDSRQVVLLKSPVNLPRIGGQ
ncbi:hypothetical protein [Myxacorys almedinensis]|uniref:SPOR domain-containing protein n=1 Tax=Myxacorys almedinensis A TaxID=2690445 RepID=A0A8J8CL88_9CYAN|nr:hypothetical protein [Myxacorys almedinensis]NDJ17495.1 hypothetical protein [Myxacorys almedinensis A]